MGDEPAAVLAEGALVLSIKGPLATLVLTRPRARNALNRAMWRAIPEIAQRLAKDRSVRVLMLRGAGGDFASGADVSEFGEVFASPESASAYLALMEAAGAALEALDQPVIAVIEGYCIGAGLALALACDLRIAAADARLGAPPAKLGLVYGPDDVRRLVGAVGIPAAKAMLLTGALTPADRALAMGLVNEVHEGDVAAAAEARALEIAALCPWSLRRTKAMINLLAAKDLEAAASGRLWFAEAVSQGDLAEGLSALSERRAPRFRDE
jgi:enoyl-CoA hydratase/carnithine racemase